MGMFDSLLTAIAPARAVKRAAAQSAIRAINSGYSNYGASLHKKSMRGWTWHGGSPKEDIEDNLRVLRERSRDAFMGVPLATGAIKTMRTNVVCGGLTPTPQIDNTFLGISDEEAQKINAQIAREFGLWANKPTCDADRLLCRMVVKTAHQRRTWRHQRKDYFFSGKTSFGSVQPDGQLPRHYAERVGRCAGIFFV
mgnify:CR=1 FL=1